jgi:hypothetical protein
VSIHVLSVAMALSVFASSSALAAEGSSARGGGNVFVCGHKVYLADTYFLRTDPEYRSIFFLLGASGDEKSAFKDAIRLLSGIDKDAAQSFQNSATRFRYTNDQNLPELDVLKDIPAGCIKRQLAIQDLSSWEIRYNRTLLDKLTVAERLLFKIHEGYIRYLAETREARPSSADAWPAVSAFAKNESFENLLLSLSREVKNYDPSHPWSEMNCSFVDKSTAGRDFEVTSYSRVNFQSPSTIPVKFYRFKGKFRGPQPGRRRSNTVTVDFPLEQQPGWSGSSVPEGVRFTGIETRAWVDFQKPRYWGHLDVGQENAESVLKIYSYSTDEPVDQIRLRCELIRR